MTKRQRNKLIKELKLEFKIVPIKIPERRAYKELEDLPKKLKMYRSVYYGSPDFDRTDQVPVHLNIFELNYLIRILDFINGEIIENGK